MKKRNILFPYDDEDMVREKVARLTKIVGKNNVNTDDISLNIPEVHVRCNKKQWKEVKFKLELYKVYY